MNTFFKKIFNAPSKKNYVITFSDTKFLKSKNFVITFSDKKFKPK